MKRINRYALTLTSAALVCGSIAAQERTDRAVEHPAQQTRPLKAGDVQASNLIGATVKSTSGQSIGEVSDLVVSSGAISAAVISVGGVLGVGEKKVAIPFKELSVAPDGRTLYLAITEEELKSRPEFDPNGERAATNRTPVTSAPEPNAAPRTSTPTTAAASSAPAQRSNAAPGRTSTSSTATATATNSAPRTLKASEEPASSLIGASVVDGQNSKIGKIHDLIVAPGRQEAEAILAVGGTAGLGSRMVAVPLGKLTIKRDAGEDRRHEPDRVQTQLTVSQLESLPEFRYE
jgi:sporulation protein YlmC with PRC-barrel domain